MRRLLQPIRFITVLSMILLYLAHMGVVWLIIRHRWRRVQLANRILSHYCRIGLKVLNVRVTPKSIDNLKSVSNALLVGNHLSYLDVLVISSQVPSCFVTSMEIKETPGLGLICQMAGCLFVERRNKTNIINEVRDISEGLAHNLNVAIFPEATSTNGEQILRFRKPLYMAAVQSSRAVLPFCINYRRVGGQPINTFTRDSVCWYGDMDFVPHLWALTGCGGVEVDLHFLKPIATGQASDPTELATQSQASVESVFVPVSQSN